MLIETFSTAAASDLVSMLLVAQSLLISNDIEYFSRMANERQRGNDIDVTGIEVGRNVYRLRRARDMSLRNLETALIGLGRHVSWSGISKLENGQRRVDADDLMALAIALNVSPLSLLLPDARTASERVPITGAPGHIPARDAWAWGAVQTPLDSSGQFVDAESAVQVFRTQAKPWWFQADSDVRTDYLPETSRQVVEKDHPEQAAAEKAQGGG